MIKAKTGTSGENGFFFEKHSFIYREIPKTISLFYFCASALSSKLYRHNLTLEEYNRLDPPPLLFFMKYLSLETLIFFVNITPVILLLTGVFSKFQSLRVLSALFYTFAYGFRCSHGINYHDQLTLVYGAIALAFMPSLTTEDKTTRTDKHIRILYFWAFHGAIFMPYFISGLTKFFYGGIYQLIFDEVSIWSPYAMAYVTEFYLGNAGFNSWIGDTIINNIWFSAPMYIIGTFLEISTLLPLFFPKLWKPIILKLLIFHIINNWLLNILFFSNFIILAILYHTPFGHPLSTLKNYYKFLKLFLIKKFKVLK